MSKFNVKNLMQWIEENKDSLKPPVCNKEIYPGGDFIVMVVGGPNERIDYHYNETPEFFYQIKGNMVLKIIEDGEFKDVPINEGEIYLLPPKVPHSPQRTAGSVGLVIEQVRDTKVHTDGFQWYCPKCKYQLHEDYFKLIDIEKQLPKVFGKFKQNKALHNCPSCDYVHKP
ncbi:MAG: 3-hydroxyanthranilate 3,4-dioxygenase [Saprospiraceae bacterium]|nr:3-hydroxyanthranilate 3,4-dioxygenase [Saprospiraceae bacterium]